MGDTPPVLLLIILFIAVPLFLEGAYLLWRDTISGERRQINRRLSMLREQSARVALRKLQREPDGPLDQALVNLLPALERLLVEAGSPRSVLTTISIIVAAGIGTTIAISIVLAPPMIVALGVGAIVGTLLPLGHLLRMRTKRLAAFARQLPDAIDLMVRGLQVGHPVPAALALVSKQMADPIGSEFGIVVDEVAYGRPLTEALTDLTRRIPQPDLRYLVAVIEIQHQSGGNLAEVLSNLGDVMRARFHMFSKIRATSAEGRMSAIAIGLMPIVITIILSTVKPDYFTAVADHPSFWKIMSVTPFMLITGWVMIWRLVNFKV